MLIANLCGLLALHRLLVGGSTALKYLSFSMDH